MKRNALQISYRGETSVRFSACHSVRGVEGPEARRHGHDYTATFTFEADELTYPGVVVDNDMRDEITRHVANRFHYRDLDFILSQPATCEAIADDLARWYVRSARLAGNAKLVSITVAAGSGAHGQVLLNAPTGR